ncbi:pre-rRNA processing and 40S ribosomal subunit assembly, partial [Desmophyllum pertusum]
LPETPIADESLVTDHSSAVPSIASVSVGEVVGNAIPLRPSSRRIKFLIEWRERTIPIVLDDTETLGTIKRMLEMQLGIPMDQQKPSGMATPSTDN